MSNVGVIKREWLPIEAAVEESARSERSLQRLAAAGHLRTQRVRVEGRLMTQYHAGDLQRIKEEGILASRVGQERNGALVRSIESAPPAIAAPERAPDGREKPLPPISVEPVRLWLPLSEASVYSGLSRTFLRQAVRAGKLKAVRAPGLRIQRESLERFSG